MIIPMQYTNDCAVVKNLLMVLSSTGGQFGSSGGGLRSTLVTATKDEVLDKHAKEAYSEEGVDDVDQDLVDNWWRASDGGSDDKEGYMRCLEGRKCSTQYRRGNKWTV